jgi:aminopeptidase N
VTVTILFCRKIEIEYASSKDGALAIQFMNKELTKDKIQPFLYSQCQAIHARSIIPCMDTPSVKQTYSAEVKNIVSTDKTLCLGHSPQRTNRVDERFGQRIGEIG